MKVLLYADHRYPAWDERGSGLETREYPSGSAYHLHDLLAKGLAEEGHDVFYHLGRGGDSPPPGVRLVHEHIPEADICHALTGPPGFAQSMLDFGARNGKPCLLTCHMMRTGESGGPNWVFVSRSLALAYGSDRVVLNGLDPGNYMFSETSQDYFVFLGTMDKAIDKGLDIALELSRKKGFRLIVAGTGRHRESIRLVTELCAAVGAEYVGDVRGPRKAELLAGARAVLFPSRLQEGCPLVILEAMFSGTPVISSPNGGSSEIVTEETGIICSSDEDWSDAVERIDQISRARCREIACGKYHYQRMTQDYLAEYERELDGSEG